MTLDELRALATGNRGGYPCWEGELGKMAVTLAGAEFLHALVALMRPAVTLELGSGTGISGRFIVEAVDSYGGTFITVERDGYYADRARELLTGTSALVEDAPPKRYTPDLVFIDSAVNWRSADIVDWLGYRPGPFVVVHDADRGYPELRLGEGIFLPSPVGFWIGRGR